MAERRRAYSLSLDGIVKMNAFLLTAVYVGLTRTVTPSWNVAQECIVGESAADWLFVFQVASFFCYLCSFHLVMGMMVVTLLLPGTATIGPAGSQPPAALELAMLWNRRKIMMIAAAVSIIGTFFLWLSIIQAIQIKFGRISCNSLPAIVAMAMVCLTGVPGLLFYGWAIVFAVRNQS